jgi:hypothetical protein
MDSSSSSGGLPAGEVVIDDMDFDDPIDDIPG